MQRSDLSPRPAEEYRQLRAITILMFPLGFALILPYAIISSLPFPAVGLAPMFFSASLGSFMYTGMLQSPSKKATIDMILTIVYFVLLVPRSVTNTLTLLATTNDYYQLA
jgi:hypothetical protein